jgi:hypothetical protein
LINLKLAAGALKTRPVGQRDLNRVKALFFRCAKIYGQKPFDDRSKMFGQQPVNPEN